jgi:hypothetical protein
MLYVQRLVKTLDGLGEQNMRRIGLGTSACAIFIVLALSACTHVQQYRTNYELCMSHTPTPLPECETHTLQQYQDAVNPDRGYLLGFVEFDDQGLLFDNRKQMKVVVDRLKDEVEKKDLLIIAFMHGWKHSAAPGDDNIKTFREVLMSLSEAENHISKIIGEPTSEIAGVYLGWRGDSLTVPLLKELTFWERKNTAQKVGHAGVTEVLNRLERIKQDKDSTVEGGSRTRFIVVGHSFGGAAVYAALSQILESGFVRTVGPKGVQSDVVGFGDLVILINPAFEALLFAPMSDMSTERDSYSKSQLPVLAVLTSEADDATKLAFPVGRRFSTFFEKEGDTGRWNATTRQDEIIDVEKANITAVGHFEPYKTHYLRATEPRREERAISTTGVKSAQVFVRTSEAWEQDQPGSKITFDDSVLERTNSSAGRNPYLVVRVDGKLIENHNDIADPRIIEFIKQLILISSQSPKQKEAREKIRIESQLQ